MDRVRMIEAGLEVVVCGGTGVEERETESGRGLSPGGDFFGWRIDAHDTKMSGYCAKLAET